MLYHSSAKKIEFNFEKTCRSARGPQMTNKHPKSINKWFIGGLIIASTIIGMSILTLDNYSVYFYTPDEAYAKAHELNGKNIKIGGLVKEGSVTWTPETLSLSFQLTDFSKHDIHVRHHGTPPDMFKEGQGVVVEGKLEKSGEHFTAKTLMVKHSEEYKAPEDPKHSMDKQLIERSMLKK